MEYIASIIILTMLMLSCFIAFLLYSAFVELLSRRCPKCQALATWKKYRKDNAWCVKDHPDHEHFDIVCRNCRYEWHMEVPKHAQPIHR